jgi:apolipoprotein N-acyltransferase
VIGPKASGASGPAAGVNRILETLYGHRTTTIRGPLAERSAMAAQPGRRLLGLRCLGAALAGVAVGAAFPPVGAVFLLPLGVAGLTFCCLRSTAAVGTVVGGAFGFALMLVLMPWLRIIGDDAWVALSLVEACFYALLGLGLSLTTRLPGWPVWAAAAWVASEWARAGVPFGGLPWGRLAFALVDTPLAAFSRLGGVAFVTAVVALAANLALWAVLAGVSRRPGRLVGGLAAAVTLVLLGLAVPLNPAAAASSSAVVAVVQGNVPEGGLRALSQARAVLHNHLAATRALAREVRTGRVPAPDLVVWPENAADVDPFADPVAAARISSAVADVGVPTLVGAVIAGPGPQHVRNVGIVWDPVTGPGAMYVKRHPVPFGEYIPFRGFFTSFISRLKQIPKDFAAGHRPGVLNVGGVRVGDVICFEVAYDGLVRDVVEGGAQLLVVQTNNATYLGTGQLAQQWAISRLRAIEADRTVAVASTDGISGFAAPDGSVLASSAPATRAVLVRRVALHSGLTPGIRYGPWIERLMVAVAVAAALAAARSSRRRPGDVGPVPAWPALEMSQA